MKTLIISLFVINICFGHDFVEPHKWNLVKQENSIRIYNTQQSDKKFKTFRLEAIFEASISRLEHVIDETQLLVDWFPMASNAVLIERRLDEMIIRINFDFPFPMKNRDAYILVRKDIIDQDQIKFTMELASGYEITPGFERLHQLVSTTTLTRAGDQVHINQTTYLDPGGNMPKVFLHNGLPPSMIKSFEKLEKLAG